METGEGSGRWAAITVEGVDTQHIGTAAHEHPGIPGTYILLERHHQALHNLAWRSDDAGIGARVSS